MIAGKDSKIGMTGWLGPEPWLRGTDRCACPRWRGTGRSMAATRTARDPRRAWSAASSARRRRRPQRSRMPWPPSQAMPFTSIGWPGGELPPLLEIGHQRVDHDVGDRACWLPSPARRSRRRPGTRPSARGRPVFIQKPSKGFGATLDRGQVLDPVGRGPARRPRAAPVAVPVRQRRAVHLEGDERVVVERLPYRAGSS